MALFCLFLLISYLINQLPELPLCGVHPHGAHSIAQLPGGDGAPAICIKLIERLLQLSYLLLAQLTRHLYSAFL